MMMFTTPNNSRRDIPCGYPKTFRRIYTGHTVKEVFHTQDAYDRFIAVGNGVSYASTFTNGYWKRAAVSGEFTSGCHFSSGNTEVNIIIRDNGEYYTSEDGVRWNCEGRISDERYDRGWSCICAGPDCVVAVNNALPKTTINADGETVVMSNGLCVRGIYDDTQKKMVWSDIATPFPSNKVRYFNEHFYIYGAILRNDIYVTDFNVLGTKYGAVTKSQDIVVSAGTSQFDVLDEGAAIVEGSIKLKTINADGIEFDYTESDVNVAINGDKITVSSSLSGGFAEDKVFRVYYDISTTEYTFNFALETEQELKNVAVIVKYGSYSVTVNATYEATASGYTATATIEDRAEASYELCCSCLDANIVSSPNYIAFSDNGANFEFVEEPLTSDTPSEAANEAAYGRGIYIAVTESGRAIYSTQTPGRNWDFIDELETLNCSWKGVAFVAGMFVVCGLRENSTVLYCSYDTKAWTEIPFIATESESGSFTITQLLSLMDLRGTLVGLALSPISTEEGSYQYADERGFFVCDTFVSVNEDEPIIVNEGLEDIPQKTLERAIAVENSVKGFDSRIDFLESTRGWFWDAVYIGENKNDATKIRKGAGDNSLMLGGENNQALSRNSGVMGNNSVAGSKGYKLKTLTNNGDGTAVCTVSDASGIEVGMRYAMKASLACLGEITGVEGNSLTLNGVPGDLTFKNEFQDENVENYIIILDAPEMGDDDTDVGVNALVMGDRCIVQNFDGLAIGRENKVYLPYGVALGRDNKAGFAAVALGYINKALGDMSLTSGHENEVTGNNAVGLGRSLVVKGYAAFGAGQGNIVDGTASFVSGVGNVADAYCVNVEGRGNIAKSGYQHVQGLYNIEDADYKYLHIVGNGSADNRSNAHTISWYGDGWFKNAIYIGGKSQFDGAKKVATEDQIKAVEDQINITKASIVKEVEKGAANYSIIIGGYANSISKNAFSGICLGGQGNIVTGAFAVAGGYYSEANYAVALAFGEKVKANHNAATALGMGTITTNSEQLVHGRYNDEKVVNKAHVVGGGTATKPQNIYMLDWSGNGEFAGTVRAGKQTTDDDNDLILVTKGYLKNLINGILQEISEIKADVDALQGGATVYPTEPGLPGYDM